MPTYKNISNSYVVVNSVTFPPNEQVEVNFYSDHSALKKVSDDPIYSPVAYSEIVSGGSFDVTTNLTPEVNLIRVIGTQSPAQIAINDSSSPKILVAPYEVLVLRPVRQYDKIFVVQGEVSIELWKEFNWRN